MCTKIQVLAQKVFTNGLNMSLSLQIHIETTVHSQVKKKLKELQSVKKVMLTVV